jgi:hypothetical protein
MIRTIAFALVLLLSGCAADGVPKAVVDTLCLTAKKKGWSPNDAPETIRDARAGTGRSIGTAPLAAGANR